MAPPCPPPIHSVAMPRLVPSRFIALTRCSTMRLPLQPTGCPRLIAPPSTFSFVWSICPAAPSSPRISRQNFSSFQAARHPSTWVANASFNSQVSISPSANLLRFKSSVADSTGPRPMMLGSSADHWLSTITALGVRPCFLTASSDARMVHDAPSVICEELPGGDLAPWRLEHRLQFGKRLRRGIRSHAVVVIVEFAVAGERGFDLAPEKTLRLRIGKPLVTFGGVGVRLRARDAEEMADHFRRLSHVELGDRIGQS